MKLKKILAVTLGATIALSTAVALTACGDDEPKGPASLGTTTEINIDNYLMDLNEVADEISQSKTAYSTATKINDEGETVYTSASNNNFITFVKDSKYRVYSASAQKFIASNLDIAPQNTNLGSYYNYELGESVRLAAAVIRSTDAQDNVVSEYKAADGTTLLAAGQYMGVTANATYYYVGNDDEQSPVWKVTGFVSEGDDGVKYFK